MSALVWCEMKHYKIGCPIWGHKEWVGKYFPAGTKSKDYLRQYSRILSTVEGNTTFYGIPRPETVLKWKESVAEDFKFCFKFPREITHTNHLFHAQDLTLQFFKALEPLADQLGVLFIQLPPSFSATGLSALQNYLQSLPQDFHYVVEPRHPDYFDKGATEKRFDELLVNSGCDRVNFTTSVLHAIESDNEHVVVAQKKKPKLPDRITALGPHPFFRYVGHLDVESNRGPLETIAGHVAGWIEEKRHPYVFLHSPGEDLTAPGICRLFHELLSEKVKGITLEPLPRWNIEEETSLFDM